MVDRDRDLSRKRSTWEFPFDVSDSRGSCSMLDKRLYRNGMLSRRQSFLLMTATAAAIAGLPTNTDAASDENGFEIQLRAMGSLLNIRYLLSEHRDSLSTETVMQEAKQIVDHWNGVLSDYDDTSEAMRLGKQADDGDWCPVSDSLAEALEVSASWNQSSDGAFDAALGAMTALRRRRKLPSSEAWNLAGNSIGWRHVEWQRNNQRLRTHRAGIRFDFGGIGKGLVADKVFARLREIGIRHSIINFSGNMRIGEAPEGTAGWPIELESIHSAGGLQSAPLVRLRLRNCAIATSGDRWQTFPDARSRSKSERFSHILDPATGLAVQQHQSITVIAANAAHADAAATATSVHTARSLPQWLSALERIAGVHSWWIQLEKDGYVRLLQQQTSQT